VEKGSNLFTRSDTSVTLQELFDYGSELGGVVHAVCGEDIPQTIYEFVREEKITGIVLGEPPEDAPQASGSVIEQLNLMMPFLKIEVLKRNQAADD
jgi:K+-sensing histidine kinase KdpD